MNPAARGSRSARTLAAALAAMWLAACTLRLPLPAPAPSPEDVCRTLNETLAAAVPPGESLDELQARGVRLRTPLSFAPGARPAQSSGAAVRLMISPEGSVVPGSPRTVKSLGDAQVASAMEAAALSMSFEFETGAKPDAPIPFTTVYAACPRS